ncbi:MAG TPA: energy transducer TonB [Terriglobales bacterium]|nr:energy transducer TonB [Terriglobales bacterium]
MFAETLLESGNVHQRGLGWATTLSITIQTMLIAALIALPIFRPDALPLQMKTLTAPIAFGRPHSPSPPPTTTRQPATNATAQFVFTGRIPTHPATLSSDQAPGPYVPGTLIAGVPSGVRNLFPATTVSLNPPPVPDRPVAHPRISVPDPGKVVFQTQPIYPTIAIQSRQEGTVILRAVIDRSGRISNVQVLSGPALLQRAARDAVEQWRYRPYILNGQPVEVETQITVNFKLSK